MSDPDFFTWLRQAPAFLARAVGREPGNVRIVIAYVKSAHGMEWLLPIDEATGQAVPTPMLPDAALPIIDNPEEVFIARDLDETDLAILRACPLPVQAKEIARKVGLPKADAELRRRLSRLRNRLALLDHVKAGYFLTARGRRVLTLA